MAFSGIFDSSSLRAGDSPLVHRGVTIAGGSAVNAVTPLPRGTVLGRVTATDKYIPCVKTAADGSQNPAAITAEITDASGGDVAAPAYFEGEFAAERLSFDVSWTPATLETALRIANIPLVVRVLGTLG